MGFFGDVIDNVGTALNLGEFGISEAIAGGNKTSNTGRVAYQNSVVSPVTAAPYAKAISQVNGGGGGTGPVVDDGSGGGGGGGYAGGNAVAAKAAAAKKALQLNVQGAQAGSKQAARDTANKYRTDVQSFLDTTEAKQNQINTDRTGAKLNNIRTIASIVNAVRNGLKSGGVTLANMNASDSSASDALARAYAKEGNGQTADANNDYTLADNALVGQQALLDRSKQDSLGNFDSFRDTEIGRIRGDLTNKLQGFDAAAQADGGGGVDMGIVDQVIAEAISQLSQVDQMKQQRLGGIQGKTADQIAADAQGMNTAGAAGSTPFTAGEGGIDLTTQDPAAENTTNPIAIKRKDTATALA